MAINYYIPTNTENIFIYKQETNEVIHTPTNNLPLGIGLTTDIDEDNFKENTFNLNTGDILFLATDGLSESYKNGNPNNEQFNDDRIIHLLKTEILQQAIAI